MKTGISLSGGGAKGIAHIGVLQALMDHDIQIDMIAGTSAGAIIGALFAAGIPAKDMLSSIRNTNFLRIFGLNWPDKGLGDMSYLKQLLEKLLKDDSFEALSKPLYVPVMNLNTGQVEIKAKEIYLISYVPPVLYPYCSVQYKSVIANTWMVVSV